MDFETGAAGVSSIRPKRVLMEDTRGLIGTWDVLYVRKRRRSVGWLAQGLSCPSSYWQAGRLYITHTHTHCRLYLGIPLDFLRVLHSYSSVGSYYYSAT